MNIVYGYCISIHCVSYRVIDRSLYPLIRSVQKNVECFLILENCLAISWGHCTLLG